MAFPFFHYLRKAYPKAHIASVCTEWVEDVQYQGLVDQVFTLPRKLHGGVREKVSQLEETAKRLKAEGPWDLAISLPNSFSAAWLIYRSGCEIRRGYRMEGRGLLLNEGLSWNEDDGRHRAQAYVDLLPTDARPERPVAEFWGIPPENKLDEAVPGELELFDAEKYWRATEPVEPPGGKYWVLAPGAIADSRRWPEEYFAALARKVQATTGWKGVIVGGPKEAPIAMRLTEDPALNLLDMTAQGPVTELWKLFRNSQFTVTNESGLAHVASLCGAFTQIVCGAADPRRTRPIGPGRVQVAINPVECWPCERNVCSQPAQKKIQCLRGIRAETVWEEIQRGRV